MYVIMDMGTTNTRLYLCRDDRPMGSVKGSFGAAFGKKYGRRELLRQVEVLLKELLDKSTLDGEAVECILAVGMAGSEMGLWEISHMPLPADARSLAENIRRVELDGIPIPFLMVPGVKKIDGERLLDMMRGEEVEAVGLAHKLQLTCDAVFLLPGTHNKIVHVSAGGEIRDLYTTFSGELLDSLISHTILKGQAAHDFRLVPAQVRRGAAYARENGLNAAAYHVRVMAKNGESVDAASSFLYGSVLGEDVGLIRRASQGKTIYLSGRNVLREAYAILLEEDDVVVLQSEGDFQPMVTGAMKIKEIYDAEFC